MPTNFKTVKPADGGIHRITTGQLRVCSVDDDKNYKVKLMLLNEKVNGNNWKYTKVAEHVNSGEGSNIPILYSVINGKVGNSHDFEIVRDERGNEYASFIGANSEHPYGWVPAYLSDGKLNARMENIDGVDWLTATGYLPTFYNHEMIRELETHGGQMPISIETLVSEYHMEGDVEVETAYRIIGVTILGVTTRPAVEGANVSNRRLSLNGCELEKLKLRVASLIEAESINKEPQTQKTTTTNHNSKKGETKTMPINFDDVKNKFGDKFTALAVNDKTVALLGDDSKLYSYTFNENADETIASERITRVNAACVLGEGETAVNLTGEQLIGSYKAQLNSVQTALDAKTKECADLKEKVNSMTAAEIKRRKEVVKDAIKAQLKDNQENCNAEIADNLCDDLLADEKVAAYAEMCDAQGCFTGDAVARKDVDERCMAKVRDAAKQAKLNSKKAAFSWRDAMEKNGGSGDDSADVLAKLNDYMSR